MTAREPSIVVVSQPGLDDTGPLEHQLEQLCSILSAVATVSILAPRLTDDSDLREEYPIETVGSDTFADSIPGAILQFIRLQIRLGVAIARSDADVALFYGSTTYIVPMALARLGGVDVIVQPKGDIPTACYAQWRQSIPEPLAYSLSRGVWLMERVGYRLATGVAVYTPSMARSLGLNPESESVYADAARFVDTDAFSVQVPLSERSETVVFIGRLHAEKRIDVIRAAAHRNPTTRFIIVGDGPEANRLEKPPANLTHAGWVDHDEIPIYLNQASALILASEQEGLPSVALEAFACGTPVVAPRVGGVDDVITDSLTGDVYTSPDPDRLTEAIDRVLTDYNDQKLQENCRAVAEVRYSKSAAIERYRTMLAHLSTQYHDATAATDAAEVPA
jgi:glycosyltransferase involved in cell wall biosynthesis